MQVGKAELGQTTSQTTSGTSSTDIKVDVSAFQAFLEKSLNSGSAKTTNEEAVFSALIQKEVSETNNTDAIKKFEERIAKHRNILQHRAGYVSEEKAAKFALRDLVRKHLVSKDDATKMYSTAFSAAQLDKDTNALNDGIGDSGSAKTSIAIGSAVKKLGTLLNSPQILALRNLGEGSTASASTASSTGTTTTPSSAAVDGPNGFLFKPKADKDGRLVILLPESMTSNISAVLLKDQSGNVIENGKSAGVGNGDREHFRFSKSGSSYLKNLTVEVRLKDGTTKDYLIPDPSLRYD